MSLSGRTSYNYSLLGNMTIGFWKAGQLAKSFHEHYHLSRSGKRERRLVMKVPTATKALVNQPTAARLAMGARQNVEPAESFADWGKSPTNLPGGTLVTH